MNCDEDVVSRVSIRLRVCNRMPRMSAYTETLAYDVRERNLHWQHYEAHTEVLPNSANLHW